MRDRTLSSGQESVIRDVQDWLVQGQKVWLCTIVETWGSSPRPKGSWLAVSESGLWSGSVSGGCLEEDLLRRTSSECPEHPVVVDYGITDQDRDHFQLPCGGTIRLLVEPLVSDSASAHIDELVTAMRQRRPVVRRVGLNRALNGELDRPDVSPAPAGNGTFVRFDGETLEHRLQPECRLLLIGAGEVARYVAEFASAAEFDVTICEPRDAFAEGWAHSHIPLVRQLPDDLVTSEFSDAWAGVLALAHDPRIDDMGLLAALVSQAFYVGAMGSKQTSEARRERLLSLGLDEAVLERLRAPIGVNIPSKTPAEIAISIVADLIAARHHLRATPPSL
ncbi:XdhC family protein [Marinobacter salinexigens]|uniref:XdhC family protein n=1 Tax=Marinobacter salinexigens TaxID=2919747 RepID=UPI001FEAE464|nr:XdhC family protein [Marinobacter salinexigens]